MRKGENIKRTKGDVAVKNMELGKVDFFLYFMFKGDFLHPYMYSTD